MVPTKSSSEWDRRLEAVGDAQGCRRGASADSSLGRRGQLIPMAALMIFVLVAFLGMGTDVGYLLLRKRQMQNAADAGAMWAVQEIRRGKISPTPHPDVVAEGEAGTSENLFPNGVAGVQVTVNHPPSSGGFVDNNLAVEVIICQQQRVFFMGALNFTSSNVCARGVAAYVANSENCIYAMNPTDEKTLNVASSGAVLEAECGIIVNSSNNGGLYVESGGCLEATSIGVTANDYDDTGDCPRPSIIEPDPITKTPPAADPLAHIPPPPIGPCITNFQIEASGPLLAGNYCGGVQVPSGVQVTLSGIYVFSGEMFDIQGDGAKVTGTETMLYFTNGNIESKGLKVGSAAELDLTSPTSGPYEGITIFVDRNLGNVPFHTADVSFESDSIVTVNGGIYALNQIVRVHSQTLGASGLGQGTVIVADTILVTSSDTFLDVNADFSFLPGGSPIKQPALVE